LSGKIWKKEEEMSSSGKPFLRLKSQHWRLVAAALLCLIIFSAEKGEDGCKDRTTGYLMITNDTVYLLDIKYRNDLDELGEVRQAPLISDTFTVKEGLYWWSATSVEPPLRMGWGGPFRVHTGETMHLVIKMRGQQSSELTVSLSVGGEQ
jgi:hypothetical protein